jgi:uncharacterized protein (TIGR02594 family)
MVHLHQDLDSPCDPSRSTRKVVKDRRKFMSGLSFSLLHLGLRSAISHAQVPVENLPSGIGTKPDFDGPLPRLSGELGKSPALKAEQQVARAILAKAPKGPTPIEVAKFFLAVGAGDYGVTWKPYTMGWPERWNPVIVNFFHATKTIPEGDVTSWCAAFLNWCFQQVNGVPATDSASSGSFRTFGTEVLSPAQGDIVVFQSTNQVESEKGHGHVGFVVKVSGEEVEVLGGNQIQGHEHSHMISSVRFKKNGNFLRLHSYRSDPRLRSVKISFSPYFPAPNSR